MGEWGGLLRERRQDRGLSLAEVEEATRIQRKHLEAFEEEAYERLPNGVYLRGLLRSYARYLGLDPEEIVALCQQGAEEEGVRISPPVGVQPSRGAPLFTPDLLVGLAILSAVILFGLWVYTQYIAPAAQPTPAPQPAQSPILTPKAISTSSTEIAIKARIVERTWVMVNMDGRAAFEGIINEGEERTWIGKEQITIQSANAGGVLVSLQGGRWQALGERGELATWEWRRDERGITISKKGLGASMKTPPRHEARA